MTKVADYRLKLERARKHKLDIDSEIKAFIATNPYVTYRDGAYYKLRIERCIPVEWSAIIGDCIHNIRASLDLLTVAIVKHCDPGRASYNHVHFIARETKKQFDDDLPRNIRGASAAAKNMIEDLKPYRGGEELLLQLHQLDILDKHNAIIPVGSAYHSLGHRHDFNKVFPNFLPEGQRFPEFPFVFIQPADRLYPLKDGDTLLGIGDDVNAAHMDTAFRFDVVFGNNQILDGEPIAKTLSRMGQLVESIFDKFEATILR